MLDDTDCDVDDDSVYPGAPEVCDGVANDCDDLSWSSDAGLATFFDADGTATDMTSDLGAGTVDTAAELGLSGGGTVNRAAGGRGRAGLKGVVVAGYAGKAALTHGHLEHGRQVVTKPFDMGDLTRRIQTIIADD